MEKSQLVEQGVSLFNFDSLRSAVESAASNPKVAAASVAATGSMGWMAKLEMINSVLGTVSLAVGVVTGLLIMSVWAIKAVRIYRSWTPNRPDSKDCP